MPFDNAAAHDVIAGSSFLCLVIFQTHFYFDGPINSCGQTCGLTKIEKGSCQATTLLIFLFLPYRISAVPIRSGPVRFKIKCIELDPIQ